MNTRELIKKELIGTPITVIDSTNENLIGTNGTIINETKNTLTLDNGKTIIKNQTTLKITMDNETFIINGKNLIGTPEDRLKKVKHFEE